MLLWWWCDFFFCFSKIIILNSKKLEIIQIIKNIPLRCVFLLNKEYIILEEITNNFIKHGYYVKKINNIFYFKKQNNDKIENQIFKCPLILRNGNIVFIISDSKLKVMK